MSAWLEHVKKTMKQHKGKQLKEVLQIAKKTYKSKSVVGKKSGKKVARKTGKKVAKRSSKKTAKKGRKSRRR